MSGSPVAILADANGLFTTSVGDGSLRRTQVENQIFSPASARTVNQALLNAGSANMMVAGSVAVPSNFSIAPAAGQTFYIESVTLLLVATTINFNGAKFLNGTSLIGGISINSTFSGVTSTMATFKQNEDFLLYSSASSFGAATPAGLLSGGTNSILSTNLRFRQPLVATNGDLFFVSIKDNLTSAATGGNLLYFQCGVQGYVAV